MTLTSEYSPEDAGIAVAAERLVGGHHTVEEAACHLQTADAGNKPSVTCKRWRLRQKCRNSFQKRMSIAPEMPPLEPDKSRHLGRNIALGRSCQLTAIFTSESWFQIASCDKFVGDQGRFSYGGTSKRPPPHTHTREHCRFSGTED